MKARLKTPCRSVLRWKNIAFQYKVLNGGHKLPNYALDIDRHIVVSGHYELVETASEWRQWIGAVVAYCFYRTFTQKCLVTREKLQAGALPAKKCIGSMVNDIIKLENQAWCV